MQVIGVDIGATKVNVLRVNHSGEVLARYWRLHGATAGNDAFACARWLVREAMDAAGREQPAIEAIGVSVAGLVDTRNGILVDGGLLHVRDVPVQRELEAWSGVPVVVENDANATLVTALAASKPAHPESTCLLLALGTGIGGAVGIGRHVLHGSFGFGGELGHLPVAPADGLRCVCGSTGCLELFASGSGVARQAVERARVGEAGGLLADSGKGWHELTAVDIVKAADEGERFSIRLLESAGDAIGRMIAGLGTALDPEVVFISGSFGHASAHHIIPSIRKRVRLQHAYPAVRPVPAIRLDETGPDAAAVGAAILAQRHMEQRSGLDTELLRHERVRE